MKEKKNFFLKTWEKKKKKNLSTQENNENK